MTQGREEPSPGETFKGRYCSSPPAGATQLCVPLATATRGTEGAASVIFGDQAGRRELLINSLGSRNGCQRASPHLIIIHISPHSIYALKLLKRS